MIVGHERENSDNLKKVSGTIIEISLGTAREHSQI
jgi:hypothetical protein